MSHKIRILNYLRTAGSNGLTQMEALNLFRCMRLASRISELREDGHDILTETIDTGKKRYARYVLIKECNNG